MFGEKHDLVSELPEHRERILELKATDRQFGKLYDEYHELDNEIWSMEEGIETPSDEKETALSQGSAVQYDYEDGIISASPQAGKHSPDPRSEVPLPAR